MDHEKDQLPSIIEPLYPSSEPKTMNVDIVSLLTSNDSNQGFLVNRLGEKVYIADLRGKTVGLYFVRSQCGLGWLYLTKVLARIYKQLADKKFEFILVAPFEDEDSYKRLITAMPWPAIPFSPEGVAVMHKVRKLLEVKGYPHLVFIDDAGNVYQDKNYTWIYLVQDYEAEAYPFTKERIDQLKETDRIAKENITLRSLLNSTFLVNKEGKKIPPFEELEGKTVLLAFLTFEMHTEFIKKLVGIHEELKKRGESFEIVTVVMDDDEEDHNHILESTPWPALPFKDETFVKLQRYYRPFLFPMVVIFGPEGKELQQKGYELIEDYGLEACPFTSEKLAEIDRKRKESFREMTVKSLLVSEGKDSVLDRNRHEVQVSDLVGKHILFYFTLGWTEDGRNLTEKLVPAYREAKEKSDRFEVIYVPNGEANTVFDQFVSGMPWLHLPLYDPRVEPMFAKFQRPQPPPYMIALRPEGGGARTTEDEELLVAFGDDVLSLFANVVNNLAFE